MLDFDDTKDYGLPMDESLKSMRIKRNPVRLGEGLVCNDQLESKGIIQIMEYTGESLYIQVNPDDAVGETNVVMVAEVAISVDLEQRVVRINRIYYEYGQDELVTVLMGQILNFADFYNCRLCISDLNKARRLEAQAAISRKIAFAGGRQLSGYKL